MNRVDELHYGLRCAICEERFKSGDDVRFDNDLNRFHTECLEDNE